MDNEMIERCVKASFDCWNNHNGLNYIVEDMSDSEKNFSKKHIIEILKAMREPTEKMKTAIDNSLNDFDKGKNLWSDVIDSILND